MSMKGESNKNSLKSNMYARENVRWTLITRRQRDIILLF